MIREHCQLAMGLVLMAFFIKAITPSAFMLNLCDDSLLAVTICPEATGGLQHLQMVMPGKEHHGDHQNSGQKGEHCAFDELSSGMAIGVDAILLAVAFAFILAPGLAPTQHLPLRRNTYLWPAAGLMDTEIRCFIELEEQDATKEAQP